VDLHAPGSGREPRHLGGKSDLRRGLLLQRLTEQLLGGGLRTQEKLGMLGIILKLVERKAQQRPIAVGVPEPDVVLDDPFA
jgi:hypothetical protein